MENTILRNPSKEELESSISGFCQLSGTMLHESATSALGQNLGEAHIVPSLSVHSGYMLGRLYVSSSPTDGLSSFSSVVYVVSPAQSLIVLTEDRDTREGPVLGDLKTIANASSSGGELILGLLKMSVVNLSAHIQSVDSQLAQIQNDVRLASTVKLNRATELLANCNSRTYPAEIEILGVELLIFGLEEIGTNLAQDKLDLRDSTGWEMFGKDLEVTAGEVALQCRQLRARSSSLIRGLSSIFSEIQRQQNENQRSSNRQVSSLAFLFFLPLLMLNFYSQFFAEGEIWSNNWTTNLFWIAIALVELGAFLFLRARRWLR